MSIQLSIRKPSGESTTVDVEPAALVRDIKIAIFQKDRIPADEQRLMHGGKPLRDEAEVSSCGMNCDATIQLLLRLRGGATAVGFTFASMDNGQLVEFSKSAPSYRSIAPGFNLEGKCSYKGCNGNNKYVWAHKDFDDSGKKSGNGIKSRYGRFDIGIAIHHVKCPLCGSRMDPETIKSCGFYSCSYVFEGYKLGSGYQRGASETWDLNKFEYHNGNKSFSSWTHLVITVSKNHLKKKDSNTDMYHDEIFEL